MDRYEEAAMEWCPDPLDHAYHSDRHRCKSVAAFGRACAAEAYEDADKMTSEFAERWPNGNSDPYPTYESDILPLAGRFSDRAAALRAPAAKAGKP